MNPLQFQLTAKEEVHARIVDAMGQGLGLHPAEWRELMSALIQREPREAAATTGSTHVAGDLVIDSGAHWVDAAQTAVIAWFGDLDIDGDLVLEGTDYQPIVFISGTLRARHLIKGAPPLFVMGGLELHGSYYGIHNDGLLRIGGQLSAQNYIHRARATGGVAGHIIMGEVSAREFNIGAPGLTHRLLSEVFCPEALVSESSGEDGIASRLRAGLPVWREKTTPRAESSPVAVPPLQLREAPLTTGRPMALGEATRVTERLVESALSGSRQLQRGSFKFLAANALVRSNRPVLVLPADSRCFGDLLLESDAGWTAKGEFGGLICLGDLTIEGDLVNRDPSPGPLLFVAGRLSARNIMKGGACLLVCDDAVATGVLVAHKTDGEMHVGGNLTAGLSVILGHSLQICGDMLGPVFNGQETLDARSLFIDAAFESSGSLCPSAHRIWECQRTGLTVLRPGAALSLAP